MNQQRPLLLIILVLYIFAPSILSWTMDTQGHWYRPFIIWLLVIIAAFAIQHWEKRHDL